MLLHLTIENFTIIQHLELEFKSGMTVLTGETGAGKSILIDALLLALGGRTDNRCVKAGEERCSITAEFAVQHLPAVRAWLEEHDLIAEEDCLLRRTLTADGRSRAFINGQAVPVQFLRELGSLLISIHGQHEHQSLLKADKQRFMLDAYAGHLMLVQKIQALYSSWQKKQEMLEELKLQSAQREAQLALLNYQVNELNQLALQPGEIELLDKEQRHHAHREQLLANVQQVLSLLSESEENTILQLLNKAQYLLASAQSIDETLASVNELISNAFIQLNEAESELRHYLDRIEFDPERLAFVEQRLSVIHELARKHRAPSNELPLIHQQLQATLTQLQNSDSAIEALEADIKQIASDYLENAKLLTAQRKEAAKQLTPAIEKHLQQLNMPGSSFAISFLPNDNKEFASYGLERLEFQVSTNPGHPLQSLAKIVSGGELSRISLAIHVLTAQKDTTPTLIFDEVDVGIGGSTAEVVGRLLQTLGQCVQVFCVTHLPQVAALGHQHFRVSKIIENDNTVTHVEALETENKIYEIARMLGGVKVTPQTLAHAREMVESTM
jgi:DNA repair protein RecN (Recombination protein N)